MALHSRTAPGTIRAISVDKAGLFSWRLWARRFVCSMARRRGGPPAYQPSGRGPGCGFASDRATAGVGFGLWLGSPVWFCWSLGQREIKLRRNQGPTAGGIAIFHAKTAPSPPPHPMMRWRRGGVFVFKAVGASVRAASRAVIAATSTESSSPANPPRPPSRRQSFHVRITCYR